LHGDARTQGFLVSAAAVGALAGAVYWPAAQRARAGRVIAWPRRLRLRLDRAGLSSQLWLTLAVMP